MFHGVLQPIDCCMEISKRISGTCMHKLKRLGLGHPIHEMHTQDCSKLNKHGLHFMPHVANEIQVVCPNKM